MRTDPVLVFATGEPAVAPTGGGGSLRLVAGQPEPTASLSGHERNHLFMNDGGRRFVDYSGVSGADSEADGRSFAVLDYDRDGWLDFALANANSPLLQLFRNEMGERSPGAFLALRFEGGNRSAQPVSGLGNRDGYGARVEIDVGGARLIREHRAGEGFASQNSAVLIVGLGPAEGADQVTVRWPSGVTQQLGPVPAGSLVTVYEDPAHGPNGRSHQVEPYLRAAPETRLAAGAIARPQAARLDLGAGASAAGAALRVHTTMATWCEACKAELPQIALLRRAFDREELALLGVPVDEDDAEWKLLAYMEEYRPAYEVLGDLDPEQVALVSRTVLDALGVDTLPATVVTDAQGVVLRTQPHVPSVSEVHELLAGLPR